MEYTPNKRLRKPGVGEDFNAEDLQYNLDILDKKPVAEDFADDSGWGIDQISGNPLDDVDLNRDGVTDESDVPVAIANHLGHRLNMFAYQLKRIIGLQPANGGWRSPVGAFSDAIKDYNAWSLSKIRARFRKSGGHDHRKTDPDDVHGALLGADAVHAHTAVASSALRPRHVSEGITDDEQEEAPVTVNADEVGNLNLWLNRKSVYKPVENPFDISYWGQNLRLSDNIYVRLFNDAAIMAYVNSPGWVSFTVNIKGFLQRGTKYASWAEVKNDLEKRICTMEVRNQMWYCRANKLTNPNSWDHRFFYEASGNNYVLREDRPLNKDYIMSLSTGAFRDDGTANKLEYEYVYRDGSGNSLNCESAVETLPAKTLASSAFVNQLAKPSPGDTDKPDFARHRYEKEMFIKVTGDITHQSGMLTPDNVINVTSIVRTSNVVTVDTAVNHGFLVGNLVVISGATAGLNGTFQVTQVPDLNTFKYNQVGSDLTGAVTQSPYRGFAEKEAFGNGYYFTFSITEDYFIDDSRTHRVHVFYPGLRVFEPYISYGGSDYMIWNWYGSVIINTFIGNIAADAVANKKGIDRIKVSVGKADEIEANWVERRLQIANGAVNEETIQVKNVLDGGIVEIYGTLDYDHAGGEEITHPHARLTEKAYQGRSYFYVRKMDYDYMREKASRSMKIGDEIIKIKSVQKIPIVPIELTASPVFIYKVNLYGPLSNGTATEIAGGGTGVKRLYYPVGTQINEFSHADWASKTKALFRRL